MEKEKLKAIVEEALENDRESIVSIVENYLIKVLENEMNNSDEFLKKLDKLKGIEEKIKIQEDKLNYTMFDLNNMSNGISSIIRYLFPSVNYQSIEINQSLPSFLGNYGSLNDILTKLNDELRRLSAELQCVKIRVDGIEVTLK